MHTMCVPTESTYDTKRKFLDNISWHVSSFLRVDYRLFADGVPAISAVTWDYNAIKLSNHIALTFSDSLMG